MCRRRQNEPPQIEPFIPFPTDALPEPIRGFVEAGAKAIGCCVTYLVLPMLAALAGAIGNTRRIRLKDGWTAPAIVWAAVVGESGSQKTPAFQLVMRPIRDRQRKALSNHAESAQDYEAELAHYEKAMAAWKRNSKTTEDPPTKPDPPYADRYTVSDTTVEALAPILRDNPRGVLLARDELAGWIGSFDRYAKGGKNADSAHWLSMFNGESIIVDRKTGVPRTIFVPQASVSIVGSIQPAILHRTLGLEHRESGLAARLLLTCPPRKPKQWTEADVQPEAKQAIEAVFDRLYELQPMINHDGEPRPVVVTLTPQAKQRWKHFYNAHALEQAQLSGELAAAWSKLEEYPARLALVVHFVRWAANDPDLETADVVDADSIRAGIRLGDWFKHETKRVYAILSESDVQREQRQLMEWIETKGGSATARQTQQGHRSFATSQDAEKALTDLAKAGYGCWSQLPTTAKGGRPSRVFVLSTPSTVYETPTSPEESQGFVDGADVAELIAERAAIREYDGGLSRDEAEQAAADELGF